MTAASANDLPPSSWPRNPEYVIDFETIPARLRAEFNGETVADSRGAKVMWELGHAPVYYFPREDVRMDLLRRTEHHTHCPYKGDASYWSLSVGDRVVDNAAWSYEAPYEEMAAIKDFVSFYWDRVDAWYEDDRQVDAPPDVDSRVGADNNFAALHPELAREWHPEKNPRLKPYEFATDSRVEVWWRDSSGREWRQRIGDRVAAVD